MSAPRITAIIVAAGRGTRAGGVPKQFRDLAGKPMLRRTLEAFLDHSAIHRVVVVIGLNDATQYLSIAPQHDKLISPVTGGPTRQESVRRGLEALEGDPPTHVLVHDGARPFVSPELISRVSAGVATSDGVLPVLPVADTLRRIGDAGHLTASVEREGLAAAQTPQGFRYRPILDAHRAAALARLSFTDDAGLADWAAIPVKTVAGQPGNDKLTTAADFAAAERRFAAEAALALGDVRVGTGYDVHAFGPGSGVVLGGISIPHDHGLAGHSDADVALHALTDAVLGALGDGDIGAHFPPSDPQWKGASSDRFLAFAVERVKARGGAIGHLDLAIVAEAPKIGPHREAMRERIAAICGVTVDRVGVKATTNEGLGFVGRGEGIAAMATATIRLPFGAMP